MLCVSTFHRYDSVYALDFLKSESRELIIVCPHPLSADSFRQKLIKFNFLKSPKSWDSVTISKFVKDQLSKSFEESESELKVWRKSEILEILARAWKSMSPNLPDQAFHQVFKQITELRSFTLDIELLEDVLEEFGPEMSMVIKKLWALYEKLDILDEQKAYFDLANVLREDENSLSEKNIIVWGFDFLNAYQLDLLKALGIRNDVYVPVPYNAYKHSIHSDWVKWIEGEVHSIDEENDELDEKSSKQVITFDRGRLVEILSLAKESLITSKNPNLDIFLAERRPSVNFFQEIPYENFSFKSSINLFEPFIEKCFSEFISEHIDDSYEVVLQSLRETISEQLVALRDGNKDISFTQLKSVMLIYEEVEKWGKISDDNSEISEFDTTILKEAILLNAPRTSWLPESTPVSLHETIGAQTLVGGSINGLEGVETYQEGEMCFIVATSAYRSIKGRDNLYSEKMMEFLNAISPVPRAEFQALFIKEQLDWILTFKSSYLIIESDLLESDPFWGEFISLGDEGCDTLIKLDQRDGLDKKRPNAKVLDELLHSFYEKNDQLEVAKKALANLSASRLQSYLDCPRKFYYQYIYPLGYDAIPNDLLMPNEIGELEHEAVEMYYKRDGAKLSVAESVKITLDGYLKKGDKDLNHDLYSEVSLEVIQLLGNAVDMLGRFGVSDPSQIEFEQNLEVNQEVCPNNVRGRIDAIADTKYGRFIIDFKRTEFSIPSVNDVLEHNAIQTWFYFNFLPQRHRGKVSALGYICLRDPGESRFYTLSESTKNEMMSDLESLNLTKKNVTLIEDFEMSNDKFKKVIEETMSDIIAEKSFPPKPVDSGACTFCNISSLCSKGALS